MPGFMFYNKKGGVTAAKSQIEGLLANNLVGFVPPTAPIQQGDLIVQTKAAALTDSALTPVVRMLLAADKTANYKQGTPVAGILGVPIDGAATDALGRASGSAASPGGVIFAVPSISAGIGPDRATGRNVMSVIQAGFGNTFKARIDMNAADWPTGLNLSHQFDNQLGGVILNYGQQFPALPVGTASGSSATLAAGTYYFVTTYLTGTGESAQSAIGSTVVAATNQLSIASPAAQLGATLYRVYMGLTPAGPFYLQNGAGTAIATPYVATTPYNNTTAASPGTQNSTGVPGFTYYTVQPFAGVGGVAVGATALQACLRILAPVQEDSLYNTQVASGAIAGPFVQVEFLDAFNQNLTSTPYTSQ